jgi:serine/threonine-protein kinase RsbW
MNHTRTTIVVQTPGEMSYLYRIREFITGIAAESGIDEQDILNIELAVDEACANVIEHGYDPDSPNKSLTIQMEIDDQKLVLKIIDQGKSFDPRLKPPPDIQKLITMKRDGGLGISLIKQTMDEIDYRRTPDGRNELILTKYLQLDHHNQNMRS